MTPLADASNDALADVRVLSFDVDDTVTRDGLFEACALDAMYRARDAGLTLIAATGRPMGWAEVFAATWPVRAAVGENGAGIAVRGRATSLVLDADDAAGRRAHAKAIVRAAHPTIAVSHDDPLRRVDVAFDIGEHVCVPEASIMALRVTLEDGGFVTTRSSVHVHAMPAMYDKATGIARALALLDIDTDATGVCFVGDSPNDAAAFAAFGVSVGVANVRDHEARLETKPRYITRAERGAGFVELVDALITSRARGER